MNKGRLRAKRRQLQKLLKEVRLEMGLRQEEVARALGQPQSFVSKYESGERKLDVIEFMDVCAVLGISPAELMNRVEN